MKLNSITLALALASTAACLGSAYSLSPARATASARTAPAFVRASPPSSSSRSPSSSSSSSSSCSSSTALDAASSSSAVAASPSSYDGGDGGVMGRRGGATIGGIDAPLLLYFGLWYLGNYYYNITNKLALKAAGGASGFPLTISALQLGIGSLYGIFLWLAPDARTKPTVTLDDVSFGLRRGRGVGETRRGRRPSSFVRPGMLVVLSLDGIDRRATF
jgi:hypothetical protein